MKDKRQINIKSGSHSEFSTYVDIDGRKHLVVTETSGSRRPVITTNIYLDGEIVTTRKSEFEVDGDAGRMDVIQGFIERQHHSAVNLFKAEKAKGKKTPDDYLNDVKNLLRRRSPRSALSLLSEAIEQHPDNPFLLSYYGCLTAVVNKNFDFGVQTCKQALRTLKERVPSVGGREGRERRKSLYPVFYLNLGRAYLAADMKKLAIDSFKKGLKIDPGDRDLGWELSRLGRRKSSPVPFISRSNPINKYIGKLLHKLKQ